MTKIVRIDTDGSVTDIEGENLLAAAKAGLIPAGSTSPQGLDVVTCRAPFFEGFLVGAIDDWGRTKGLPVNYKAWACYGRSPIFGPMFLAHDQDDYGHRPDLDPMLVRMLKRSDIHDLVGDQALNAMDRILREEGLAG